jgi:hypothetical protein
MMSSLGRATCRRSGRPQLQCGYACRNIHARLRLHGHRLQGDRAMHLPAETATQAPYQPHWQWKPIVPAL